MATRIGINGFGRIGRLTLRVIESHLRDSLEVVAVNDLTDTATNAHLFKYDSNYGTFQGTVDYTEDSITVNGRPIKVISERDPAMICWSEFDVDVVIESTGLFTDASKAAAHFNGGAKKVIISAPAKGEDITIVLGVNEDKYDPERHHVLSNSSCTTNCIAPVVKVLHDNFKVVRGLMSTIHAYTNDQRLLDMYHKDLRRARSAATNILPTTTGAAKSVGVVIPDLEGKLNGAAFRVPVAVVSLCDFIADVEKTVSVESVNNAFREASMNNLKGIMEYCDIPLVSSDFRGNESSAIFDAGSTMVIEGKMVKVVAWYDNEWGYSRRLADLASYVAAKGLPETRPEATAMGAREER